MISFAALLIIFAVVMGSAAMAGVIAYLLHRIRQVEGRTLGEAGPGRILGEVHGLREDILRLEEEVASLTERVEFTDKLLLRGSDAGGDPGAE